jgi:hypothetical protein
MAIHPRRAIREAAAAKLRGRPDAAAPVFENRMLTLRRCALPAVAVYALQETVDAASASSAPRELKRTLQLAIDVVASHTDDLDDVLDELARQVEREMHGDETLSGTASDSLLASTSVDLAMDGERPAGRAQLIYSVTYYTHAPEAEDSELDDLKTVDVKTSLSGEVHPDNQAEDLLQNLDQ